ncbi:MAG: alanine racemase [Acidobacteriota bacterium]|jgi:alanine racemase|nr:alanine racemase [Acidobacteriota bacterium]
MFVNENIIPNAPGDSGGVRATWAEISLGRLKRNLDAIRQRVGKTRVMIVVKANAYGHGLVEVSKALAGKSDYIGVAVLEEGITLRRNGVKAPILVLGGVWGDQIQRYLQYDLTLTASSVERLEQIDKVAGELKTRAKVHLKIDTGMERIGIHYYNAHKLQEAAVGCRNVETEGIYSHFADADARDAGNARVQLERFNEVTRFYERRGLPVPMRHIANSAAILQLPESHMDMVRPGIMLYGVYPSPEVPRTVDVRPALEWKSRVVYFKVVRPGHPVSYGGTWQAEHETRVVTLPVGYGDGYFRRSSGRAAVIIREKKYPQVGTICMDQMMINLGRGSAWNGDEAILLGESGGERITAEDLAEWAGTIPYEILTNINTRVPRVYV